MSFGVTNFGFKTKRFEDIKSELVDALKASLGNDINLLPQSVLGQIVNIFCEREAKLWELAEAVYYSQYPDTAEGQALDNVCAITGIVRREATKSYGQGIALGTIGTIIPKDSIVSVSGTPTSKFLLKSNFEITGTLDRVQLISFSDEPASGSFKFKYKGELSPLVNYNATADDVKSALEAISTLGTNVRVEGDFVSGFLVFLRNQGSYDLLETDSNTLKNSSNLDVTIAITKQTGVECDVIAQNAGAVVAPADSLIVIETPVSGWSRFINLEDVFVGRNRETDAELRIRRIEEITFAGKATTNAIYTALKRIDGVRSVTVYQNNLAIPDLEGRPPHSVDITVFGGDTNVIAETIFNTVAAGIQTIGTLAVNVVDDQGFTHEIRFSRPTEVPIYVIVNLTIDDLVFPPNGTDLVKSKILNFGNSLGIGEDVIVVPKLIASFVEVEGILDADVYIGTSPDPTQSNNIRIAPNEVSSWDSTRIMVDIYDS